MTMVGIKQTQVLGFVGLVLGLLGVAACSEAANLTQWGHSATSVITDTSVRQGLEPTTQLLSQTAEALVFTICFESSSWQRPTETEHLKALEALPRYGSAINEEPLQSLFQKFWDHDVINFTTYGLSARLEPLYFSGLSAIEEEIWGCYPEPVPTAINTGEIAELWVMNHQVQSIQWADDRYQVTVIPTGQGVQFVQFPRQEATASPVIEVVSTDNGMIPSISGDW